MSISIEGLDDLENLFLQIQSEGPRRVVKKMIEGAHEIQELAVKMAPVDEGNLEKAIKIDVSSERDSLGRFATRVVTVYVDQTMPAGENRLGVSKVVGDYAYEIHEHVTPMGPKGLGPKSKAKQSGQSVVVGGGYLERAAEETQEKIQSEVAGALREYL